QRSGHPFVLHSFRQAIGEFTNLPRPADVHGNVSALELLVEIRDLAGTERRCELVTEQAGVIVEPLAKRRLVEGTVTPIIAEQRRTSLDSENDWRPPFGDRYEKRVLVRRHL